MAEEKQYKIQDVLTIAAEWLDDASNQEKMDAFEDMKASLVIRDYMPIAQKELLLRKALIDIKMDEEMMPYTASILYEIALVFDGLLAYVVNIDPAIDTYFKDAQFYDLLKISGLIDYILSFCEKDYNDFCKLSEKMISFDNLSELSKNLELTSPEQIQRLTDEFKRFTTETNPEVLKSLGNIAAVNDPLLTNIRTSIEDAAFKASQMATQEEAE